MQAQLALWGCAALVVVLLYIERRRSSVASFGLWIPTVWLLISGSRPVGRWFETTPTMAMDYEAGSLPDRIVLLMLIACAMAVIARRKIEWSRIVKANLWLLCLFAYMAVSILWVDAPFVSLKRWIKSAGPIMMGFIVLSESKPLEALESLMRRCAYVLVPFSFVLIKYYPALGRVYGRWDGLEMWTGTTTHKNSLGQLCAVSAVFLVWSLFRKARATDSPRGAVFWAADVGILLLALHLLRGPGTYSATAISITLVGLAIFFTLRGTETLAGWTASNLKPLTSMLVLAYVLIGDVATATVSSLLGREQNLTGRTTDIWPVVMEAASRHPIVGLGYGGVWGLGGEISFAVGVEQAHNGYLDVYLQLGLLGSALLALFLLSFCSRVRQQFESDVDWGIFGIAFLLMVVLYNVSETAFFDVYIGAIMVLLPLVFSVARQKNKSPVVVPSGLPQSPERTWRPNHGTLQSSIRRPSSLPPGTNRFKPSRAR